MNHTPGPLWVTVGPMDWTVTIHAPDGSVLCVIERRDGDTRAAWERRKADARLWAAAPKMHALLVELTDESEAHMIGSNLWRAVALLARLEAPHGK